MFDNVFKVERRLRKLVKPMKTPAGLCSLDSMQSRVECPHTEMTHRETGGGRRGVQGGDRPGFHAGRTGLWEQGHYGEGRGPSRTVPVIREHAGGARGRFISSGRQIGLYIHTQPPLPTKLATGTHFPGREKEEGSEGNEAGPTDGQNYAGDQVRTFESTHSQHQISVLLVGSEIIGV